MTKEQFFKNNDEKFIALGFIKDETDPMFYYSKCLIQDHIKEEVMEENDLREDELPALLFGNSGINQGFCIYAENVFMWLNITEPKEAVEFAEKIVSFEPTF